MLAFLPGVAEIERVAERLGDLPGIALHKLHGQIPPAAQRAAIAPEPTARKLVLATSIAETSLTLDGIRWWSIRASRAARATIARRG